MKVIDYQCCWLLYLALVYYVYEFHDVFWKQFYLNTTLCINNVFEQTTLEESLENKVKENVVSPIALQKLI